ncbi:MAG: four helix bundle protein [Chthoniobacterales bacterium]|nr:four helix bundle protein [Chthoniobacterales bacterium]
MAYRSFEELEVWQRACRQAVEVSRAFEDCKNWTFRDQIQRAALSVPSNIAEGCERNSAPDFKRFLNIALGSNAELRTQLYIAARIGIVSSVDAMVAENKEISAMLNGLRKSLKS